MGFMDLSGAKHHHQQEVGSQTLERMLVCTKPGQEEKKPRPPEQAQNCPRCDSTNTKFCYYNNYSLTQPRYFCKSCRRYWTKGGTLRNVPVGGGCRKNKRSSPSSSSSSSKRSQDQTLISTNHNPLPNFTPLPYESTDLSLAFARLQNHQIPGGQLGFEHGQDFHFDNLGNRNNGHGFLDALGADFLETPNNGFHNAYYGIGNGDGGNGVNVGEEMANLPYEDLMGTRGGDGVKTAAVKQEGCNSGGRDAENRVLWGYPWQVVGDGGMGDLDAGKQSWNGIGSTWHGLLNSPLM